jgi:hypothetical protein
MGVCRACHSLIHGHLHEVVANPGSLLDKGDSGLGIDGDIWNKYLVEKGQVS